MYDSLLASLLWYASWPVLIFVSYRLVLLGLRSFEKRASKEVEAKQ
jgi:hypothetical protein